MTVAITVKSSMADNQDTRMNYAEVHLSIK